MNLPDRVLAALLALSSAVLAQAAEPSAAYVAMGSSFAAGPGLLPYAPDAPPGCARSLANYAQQLATLRGLRVNDVSCSAATTRALLEPWNEMPAQIDALGTDTRLVTVTVGGNDVGYIGGLLAASCGKLAAQGRVSASRCRAAAEPTEADFAALARSLRELAAAVRVRAPKATLVFVDYLTVLPPAGLCEAAPLPEPAADLARRTAARLLAVTSAAAREAGALLLPASRLSAEHHACASEPWMWGYPAPAGGAPYHPNAAAMAGLAGALHEALGR
ncbi:SGNH/GDSL hydrolase family protein [Roseateles sp. DC23W]|uniref:SGNH/GDSL hydrolase family protein n=1 Tax=Pelomonas dachongensis TaxID=3299029 RepID=A0ABW7ENJ6_9BURK